MSILEVSGLTKTYPQFELCDISFAVPDGCIAGLIGVNGAGKTTTLRTMLNLTRMDSGSVRFFDLDMPGQERSIKDRLGVVFDDGCFYDELTLDEMKSILSPAYSRWSEADFRKYTDLLSLDTRQKISTLSKGTRIKFALALALSHNAELLIMDEPTSGLDPLVRRQFLDILRDYMDSCGRGVIFSTHITSDLDKIADTIVMIDDGKVVLDESKDTLLDTWRTVRGSLASLTPAARTLFRRLSETPFGFEGITEHAEQVRALMPDALFGRPSIEDIMLAHAEGGNE